MSDLPSVITSSGLQPTPPATIRANLDAALQAAVPGYTSTLPGSLIEDVLSTDTFAVAECDAALVETVNSLNPLTANAYTLSQLGQIYLGSGSAPAVPTNTSVLVTFFALDENSNPAPGYVVPVGFTVTDGTYQYVVQDGGVTATSGFTSPLFCLANTPGSWAVPANSVSALVTSVPSNITLTCINQEPGTPGGAAETEEQYRVRVLQSGLAVSQGMPTMLKTALGKVSGVQQRLISVLQQTGGWEIIVGGGDPYQVANAIYNALFDISTIVGATLNVVNITNANPGVVTTATNHQFTTGQTGVQFAGIVGMTPLNGLFIPAITVIDEKTFSIGISTLPYPSYISGGVVTPNLKNIFPALNDYPDIYIVPVVVPPQQTVSVAVTWNTTASNFVSQASVAQLAAPAIADYINSITVGAPVSILALENAFQVAVVSVLATNQISQLNFVVSINGISTPPEAGTKLIFGDPESYFFTTSASIAVTQS